MAHIVMHGTLCSTVIEEPCHVGHYGLYIKKASVNLQLPSLHPFTCFYYLFDGFLVYSSTLIEDVALGK